MAKRLPVTVITGFWAKTTVPAIAHSWRPEIGRDGQRIRQRGSMVI